MRNNSCSTRDGSLVWGVEPSPQMCGSVAQPSHYTKLRIVPLIRVLLYCCLLVCFLSAVLFLSSWKIVKKNPLQGGWRVEKCYRVLGAERTTSSFKDHFIQQFYVYFLDGVVNDWNYYHLAACPPPQTPCVRDNVSNKYTCLNMPVYLLAWWHVLVLPSTPICNPRATLS